MNKKLAIFGPYPPPLGGISVHIKRIEPFLKKNNIDYEIYNHGFEEKANVISTKKKLYWYLKLLFVKRYVIFHFHQFFLFHFFYYWFFSLVRNEKIIVTIHSERLLGYNSILKSVVLFLLLKTKKLSVISVSENLNNYLNKNGVNSIFLPAYVPPSLVSEKKIKKDKKTFLFSVWKFNQKLANEIYNVSLAFDYLSKNKSDFDMLFMIGNKSNSDLDYLNKIIKEYDVDKNIKIIFNENLVDYIKNCEFLLRPNLSDGYGISLQEALDLGVPAIGSNVCKRPKGTILFKSNDIKDLSEKINYVLNTPKSVILKEKEELLYHTKLIKIYLKILNI